VIGAPSRLRLIRKTTDLTRIDETRDLNIEEKAVRRKKSGEFVVVYYESMNRKEPEQPFKRSVLLFIMNR
jgi:hypothetical protein